MTGNVLITLGRLPKALELARAFARIGCRVVIAEPHRWHLSRVSRAVSRSIRVTAPNTDTDAYLQELTEVVDRHDIDLVVPVSDETMHVAALRERLPPQVRLYCPPQPELLELHDKLRFVRLAARHGLEVPETYLASDPAAAALSARERCIVKPVNSSAGVGLQVLERGAPPPAQAGERSVVQAFVPGDELSTFSIAHEGRVIGTAVYVGRVMSGTVAVCFERLAEPPPALLDWVERFASATGYTGFLSFDFRLDADGRPLAIECNPRTTIPRPPAPPDAGRRDTFLAEHPRPRLRRRRPRRSSAIDGGPDLTWTRRSPSAARRPTRRAALASEDDPHRRADDRRVQLAGREPEDPDLLGLGRALQPFLARIGIQADADIVVFGGLGLLFDDYWRFRRTFEDAGVFARTVMFVNQASDPIVERLLVPDMALAVAERFAVEEKKRVLVLLTDMTAYADALKEVGISMERVPSNRGYMGDLYSQLARRYEKAADFEGAAR
jgi:hypothetical protein